MERKLLFICGVFLSLAMVSCVPEEKDIFEESSALRLNHAIENYTDKLCSAENGWVMEYFSGSDYKGVLFLLKFSHDGSVTVAAKNDISTGGVYKEEKGLFEIIGDNGPVLSFNSYIPIFHEFSNPEDLPGTEGTNEDGLGYEGDYEFVIYSGTESGFYMKGKKTGIEINLYPLSGDVQWQNYFTQVETFRSSIFNSKIKYLQLEAGGEFFTVSGMSNDVLTFVPVGGDPISESTVIPCLITTDGLVLSRPFEGVENNNSGIAVKNFKLNDGGVLECVDEGQNAIISAGNVSSCFVDANYKWRLDRNQMSEKYKTLFNKMLADCQKAGYGTLQYLQYGWNSTENKMTFTFKTSKFEGEYYLDSTVDGDKAVTLAFNQEVTEASSSTKAKNAMVFYRSFESFRSMISLISTKFTLVENSPMAITAITMTDAAGNSVVVSLN